MAVMMDMMVEQAILADEIYEHHGIEEEEFNQAIFYYKLMEDPEVTRKLMQSMMKLQAIGGGMGMM